MLPTQWGLTEKSHIRGTENIFTGLTGNYYDASLKDCEVWKVMVSQGYAKEWKKDRSGGRMYWLTRKGLDWLGEKLGIYIHDEEE